MNGAESLLRTLLNCRVDTCFMNPGTSEMHFVAALDRVPGMRSVLTLFEGVATGAADGYGRMKLSPAATLLHLGPGLANGMANLHNAKKANSPIVNIVGEHATYHRGYNAPLTSDIEGMARTVSKEVLVSTSAERVAHDAAAAVARATQTPSGVCTLILPADTAWTDAKEAAQRPAEENPTCVDRDVVREAAKALESTGRNVLLLGGRALLTPGLEHAARIAAKTGAEIFGDSFSARMERGAGRVKVRRLPYFPEDVEQALQGTTNLILAGTNAPVAFFAYPGRKGDLTPEGVSPIKLAGRDDDPLSALEALADAVHAPPFSKVDKSAKQSLALPELAQGPLNADGAGQSIAALVPEGAIISDDAATSGVGPYRHTTGARPHDWLFLTGGAIGQGMPLGVGAAVACPDRKVVCLEGDGSAMYTLQSLWTQAREKLDVTNVVFSNRMYRILAIEFKRVGATDPGPKSKEMFDLSRPDLDFVKLANGMGVEAFRCETSDQFNDRFAHCMRTAGPHLIDVVL